MSPDQQRAMLGYHHNDGLILAVVVTMAPDLQLHGTTTARLPHGASVELLAMAPLEALWFAQTPAAKLEWDSLWCLPLGLERTATSLVQFMVNVGQLQLQRASVSRHPLFAFPVASTKVARLLP
ncbi:hypothetical protein PWT90_04109 [Aphanocladium album]|nr:hypothetical protein PWT90_04109 [Aphanocladium album]